MSDTIDLSKKRNRIVLALDIFLGTIFFGVLADRADEQLLLALRQDGMGQARRPRPRRRPLPDQLRAFDGSSF